jgi:NADH:ubiquinone oxidoreductase subunit 5 (subunit L)/multisubunit Na+/H+ antiporter MnhA subunit
LFLTDRYRGYDFMRKLKIAFWIILIGLLGLIVYQNQGYFLTKHSLDINLWFTRRFIPPVQNLVIIAAFFVFGLLIAMIQNLFERYRMNKTIKELRNTIHTSQTTISQMRQEIDAMKPAAAIDRPTDPAGVETPAVSKDTPT